MNFISIALILNGKVSLFLVHVKKPFFILLRRSLQVMQHCNALLIIMMFVYSIDEQQNEEHHFRQFCFKNVNKSLSCVNSLIDPVSNNKDIVNCMHACALKSKMIINYNCDINIDREWVATFLILQRLCIFFVWVPSMVEVKKVSWKCS